MGTQITHKYNKHTYKHKTQKNPLVYSNMGRLEDGSYTRQGRQAWTPKWEYPPPSTAVSYVFTCLLHNG